MDLTVSRATSLVEQKYLTQIQFLGNSLENTNESRRKNEEEYTRNIHGYLELI
jgi:hypothetical protein